MPQAAAMPLMLSRLLQVLIPPGLKKWRVPVDLSDASGIGHSGPAIRQTHGRARAGRGPGDDGVAFVRTLGADKVVDGL